MTGKALLGAAVAVLIVLVASGAVSAAGYVAQNGYYACSTVEQLDTLNRSINENVYEPYFYQYMSSGACVALEAGTPVKILDARSKKGKAKVRIPGVKKEMWVLSDAYKKK
jgi:hypothetical protein